MNTDNRHDGFWEERNIPNYRQFTVNSEDMTEMITATEENRRPNLSYLQLRKAKKVMEYNDDVYDNPSSGNTPKVTKYDAMSYEMEIFLKETIGESHINDYHYSIRNTVFFVITDVKLDTEALAECVRTKFNDYFEVFEPKEGYYIIDPIIVPVL